MSLLKSHWKRFIIASFATLWASCSEDSPSQPETSIPSSAQQEVSSSSQEYAPAIESSFNETIPPVTETSSSEAVSSAMESSSSETIPVSSSSSRQTSGFNSTDGSECIEITTFETIVLNKSDNCDDGCPVYGVPQTMTMSHTSYKCSDGNTYSLDSYRSKFGHDPIIIERR